MVVYHPAHKKLLVIGAKWQQSDGSAWHKISIVTDNVVDHRYPNPDHVVIVMDGPWFEKNPGISEGVKNKLSKVGCSTPVLKLTEFEEWLDDSPNRVDEAQNQIDNCRTDNFDDFDSTDENRIIDKLSQASEEPLLLMPVPSSDNTGLEPLPNIRLIIQEK